MVESPRATPTQVRAQAARDAIIAAVDPVIAKYGVDEASTNRIAEEAGVSVGTVYRYFPNKLVLFEEYIERYRSALDEQTREFLETGPDLSDVIGVTQAMIRRSAERLAVHPGFPSLRLWRRPDTGELIAAPLRAQESSLIEVLVRNNLTSDPDPVELTRFVEFVIETTMTLLALAPASGPERDEWVDDVVVMITSFMDAKSALHFKSGS